MNKQQSIKVGQNISDNQEVLGIGDDGSDDQQCCVMARNLDSGEVTQVDLQKLDLPLQALSARKASAWEQYWQKRQETKHQLLKIVNTNKQDDLLGMLHNTNKDVDLNQYVYMDGWSLLHQTVNRKLFDMSLILINKGCNVNAVTESMHRTPLHLAVLENCLQIVQLLLAFNANPNAVDIDLCTPVHYACEFGYVSIMKIFLEKCQNLHLDLQNIKKETVLDCCRDARIQNMINDYKVVHCIEIDQTNVRNNNKGHFIRTRSHFIERILNQSNKPPHYSCTDLDNNQSDIIKINKKKTTIPGLGSKINKQKLERFSSFAKKSLQSYKDSQVQGTIESIENYDLIRQLGSGSFGTVFLIRKKKSSKLFALKRLSKKLIIQNRMKKYAFAEREILKNVKHPFILHGYSFFQDHAYLYMVMDFCAGGDLEKCVRRNKFDQQKAKKYCCEVVLALEELHRRNYLFRDLKVSNVLLDQAGHVKLADFGLAKQSQISHSFLGSVAYLAPEMLVQTANKPHTAAIDWYLLGVFVYEMIVGIPPFFNENRIHMFESIKKQKPRIPTNLTPECKDFLLRTLAKKPNQRLGHSGAKQIKSHSWFNGVDWTNVLQRKLQMQIPYINQKQLRSRQYMQQGDIEPDKKQQNIFRGWDYFQGQKN